MSTPDPIPQPRLADPEDLPEPAPLRRLRMLVTVLTVVLIGGVLTICALLVIRLGAIGEPAPDMPDRGILPERLVLPEGATVEAIGRGRQGEILIVLTGDGGRRLVAHDAESGDLLGVSEIVPEGGAPLDSRGASE